MASFSPSFDKIAPGTQSPVFATLSDGSKISMLLYIPKTTATITAPFPCIFFLHGAAESELQQGDVDPSNVAAHGLPHHVAARMDGCFPFLLVSPKCPFPGKWNDAVGLLDQLYDDIIVQHPNLVDVCRVYLTGLSMGGNGTWMWGSHSPQKFAAIAPVCPYYRQPDREAAAAKLASLPIWVFHGVNDIILPVSDTDDMVERIRGQKKQHNHEDHELRYTRYEHCFAPFQPLDSSGVREPLQEGHDAWTEAYKDDSALFGWFLKHKK